MITRRTFLLSSASACAAGLMRATPAEARWALLSDTHVPADPNDAWRGFRPFENLQRAVPRILEAPLDGALVTGDLARQRGTAGEYESAKRLLAPLAGRAPLAISLGNHDDRESFLSNFLAPAGARQAVEAKQVTVVDAGPVRLVFLDSLFVPGQVAGLLGKAQRSWLDGYLGREVSTPALLFLHHTLDDGDGDLLDADRFLRIAGSHRNVKAVFYGHSHRYGVDALDGMHLVNLPACGYNFEDNQPVGWIAGRFTKEGCDLRLHAIAGNRADDGRIRSLSWR